MVLALLPPLVLMLLLLLRLRLRLLLITTVFLLGLLRKLELDLARELQADAAGVAAAHVDPLDRAQRAHPPQPGDELRAARERDEVGRALRGVPGGERERRRRLLRRS